MSKPDPLQIHRAGANLSHSVPRSALLEEVEPAGTVETIQSHDIKRSAARGGAVAVTSQAARFILRTGSMIALARILTPNEFGIVAMATVFIGFLGIFKDAGLSAASVQQEAISHAQMSTLF